MIDSVVVFLSQNPEYIFITVFIVALCESLAVVGIIVPGVGLITAASIMAGNLQLDVFLLLVCAITGAFMGDVASFYLGRFFQPNLPNIWPFKQHPSWINNGHDFFAQHGGKSIFFGRFIGPIRPFIPMVAGMMAMPQNYFMLLNGLSAIAWGLVYLLPSYYLGEQLNIEWLLSWQGILALGVISAIAVLVSILLKTKK
ncbi:DedA family protein [Bermanella sp. WJH001]|uniref:DedA family protein n=1 Tax=Bermanella sp. WJH001 TaxID=3048005 RepID=UPI0024BE4C53|nr:DedA family protein [Bermanella sp. WJH001]MDJ1539577.1 DedA family protein [Bermanella sp. WJH001]